MAQFIHTNINVINDDFLNNIEQVSIIVNNEQRTIGIHYDTNTQRVVVQTTGRWFYLTSPDIHNLTIKQVIEGLGYGDDRIVVTWVSNDQVDGILNSTAGQAPLSLIHLYNANANANPNRG